MGFGACEGPWNQPLVDTKGKLYRIIWNGNESPWTHHPGSIMIDVCCSFSSLIPLTFFFSASSSSISIFTSLTLPLSVGTSKANSRLCIIHL